VQKRALPATTFADYGNHLASLDGQVHATKDVECHAIAADVALPDVAPLQDGRHSDRMASTGYSLAA
jgi:hypothetical protein